MLAMVPPGPTSLLTEQEGGGHANGLDRGVDAAAAGQLLHRLGRISVRAVDRLRRAELPGKPQTVVVEIDHDDLGRRIELRGQQCGETDRSSADDGDCRARRYLAVEHAAFEAGRQDVAQHHQRLLVSACGDRVETGVGMRRADIFRLGSVDLVAEDPAAGRAVRVHAAPAVLAFAAG